MKPVLGEKTDYPLQYSPDLLVPIPRASARTELGLVDILPFTGVDIWNCYEVSWLDRTHKPACGILQFSYPCESQFLLESKSVKLYLMSFNNYVLPSAEEFLDTCRKDLTSILSNPNGRSDLLVKWFDAAEWNQLRPGDLSAITIDGSDFTPNLKLQLAKSTPNSETVVDQVLISHLWRSRCPVTGQPDYGTVVVCYRGHPIDRSSLLSTIVSLREHRGFHEECTERLFLLISECCRPEELSVSIRFTRRGGIDINPVRSSHGLGTLLAIPRTIRQ